VASAASGAAVSEALACGNPHLERFPKRLNRDSHAGANMIQAAYWEEASMDGEAVLGGLA
jgi:hypothetical protein